MFLTNYSCSPGIELGIFLKKKQMPVKKSQKNGNPKDLGITFSPAFDLTHAPRRQ
jgi:hypothetical protein